MNFSGMAAVELPLNATYAQNAALKSVHEKSQSVMGGKLFTYFSANLKKYLTSFYLKDTDSFWEAHYILWFNITDSLHKKLTVLFNVRPIKQKH